jgi:acetyl esterase
MAKDRRLDAIKAQVLLYPAVSFNKVYPSYEAYGNGDCYLSLKEAELCAQAYLGKGDVQNKYALPILASAHDMEGLPPAFVLTCECDMLRDEGEAYAAKLTTANVYTSGMRVLGAIHGFFSAPLPETPQYRNSLHAVIGFIKDQLKY